MVCISCVYIPVCDRRSCGFRAEAMELEPDVDTALEWASSLLPVLQQLLDKPFDDHDVSKYLPAGGLRVARVVGLVRLLNANTRPHKGPWLKHFHPSTSSQPTVR